MRDRRRAVSVAAEGLAGSSLRSALNVSNHNVKFEKPRWLTLKKRVACVGSSL